MSGPATTSATFAFDEISFWSFLIEDVGFFSKFMLSLSTPKTCDGEDAEEINTGTVGVG